MNRLSASLVALTAIVCLAGGAAYTQSLAEVARKEEQRRQTVGKATKVYTNKDLQPARPGSSVTAEPSGAAETGTTEPRAAEGGDQRPGAGGGKAPAQPASDEGGPKQYTQEQWRQRMEDARTELERTRMFAEALQSRVNALWADFSARDDPAQRAAIQTERQRALAELERVKTEIETRTKTIADIEEEARRSGVPPGWLR